MSSPTRLSSGGGEEEGLEDMEKEGLEEKTKQLQKNDNSEWEDRRMPRAQA